MIIRQISVFLENRDGQLAEITDVLAKNAVSLMAIHIAETSDYGVVRLLCDQPERAESLLRQSGFILRTNRVVAAAVPDRPGGLNDLLSAVSREKIGIEYLYSAFGRIDRSDFIVLRCSDSDRLEAVLEREGYTAADRLKA